MLKKLLKYDFNAIFKYWWIGALTTFILSFIGGWCGSVYESPKDLPDSVYVFATIGLVITVLSFAAFVIMTVLLVYIRFYKHLFSDEGYLTFTLPVKRNQLLNSKLVSGGFATFSTVLVTAINVLIIVLITNKRYISVHGWFNEEIIASINDFFKTYGTFNAVVGIIEILFIVVLTTILATLFAYLCITIGAIISKKAKLASTIGIYYGASVIITIFMYIFYFFGFESLNDWITDLPENQEFAIFPLILLLAIFTILMISLVTYTLINWLIDRKLNLN